MKCYYWTLSSDKITNIFKLAKLIGESYFLAIFNISPMSSKLTCGSKFDISMYRWPGIFGSGVTLGTTNNVLE